MTGMGMKDAKWDILPIDIHYQNSLIRSDEAVLPKERNEPFSKNIFENYEADFKIFWGVNKGLRWIFLVEWAQNRNVRYIMSPYYIKVHKNLWNCVAHTTMNFLCRIQDLFRFNLAITRDIVLTKVINLHHQGHRGIVRTKLINLHYPWGGFNSQ